MKKRVWPQHLHIVAASAIFLAVLVLIYRITALHNRRLDITQEKVHSLSPETLQILNSMKEGRIKIRGFFAEEDQARREFEVLAKEAATHHPHFHYQIYDPDRAPLEARRYKIEAYQTVVVEYQGHEERFQGSGEEALTNALVRAAHPETRTLCFTTGHGEVSLSETERSGYSEWKKILESHPYRVKEIGLLTQDIPSDCDTVVVAGPRYEFLPREADLLQRYPETGKGLLLLLDPMDPGEGKSFNQLVDSFGMKLGQDVVVDKVSRLFGGDFLVPLVSQFKEHPITKRFRGAIFLPIARTVRKKAQVPSSLQVTELALTTPGTWAETDLKKLENGEAEANAETDMPGPLPLVAVAEMPEAPKGARVVVIGDSDFLANAHLRLSANRDFAFNVLQWLVRDDQWISIRPKSPRFEPLFLRVNQSVGVAAFAIGGLPFTVLLASSIGIWIRRREN